MLLLERSGCVAEDLTTVLEIKSGNVVNDWSALCSLGTCVGSKTLNTRPLHEVSQEPSHLNQDQVSELV